jgi:pimeloyl-ACP methyl ester carboxylesterase
MSTYRFSSAITAAVLAVSCAAATAAAPSPAPAPAVHACTVRKTAEPALCGALTVFEDRERRAGRTITLNVMVLPALSRPAEPDPFVVLVGGPGEAATAEAADSAARFAAIRARRDIVLVDQRGTGGSNALRCGAPELELVRGYFVGDVTPDAVRDCRQRLLASADPRLYTTPLAADDLDDVRAWLRYPRINVYGSSYGTRVALVYLRRHGDRVRTATLRGVLSTAETKPLREARDAQVALEALFAACEQDAACNAAFPRVRTELGDVLSRLSSAPMSLGVRNTRTGQTITVPITRELFAGVVRRLLYDTDFQSLVPFVIHAAYGGDVTPLRRFVGQSFALESFVSVGMNLSVRCSEDVPLLDPAEIAGAAAGTFLGRTAPDAARATCADWPHAALPASYREPVRSAVPVLIFSGAIDPDTPPDRGETAVRTLANASHVVLPAIAHSPFPPCAVDIMARFVERGTMHGVTTEACTSSLHRPPFVLGS